MDFVWTTPNVGDITEVQAGTGISVASGTGPIPVVTNTVATAFDAKGDLIVGTGADTFAKRTVGSNETRLVADSVESTGIKWVADTTNYAIAAKGDLLAGTAADTVAPLTLGTNNQVLTVDTSTATGLKWAAPSSGALTLISRTTWSSASSHIVDNVFTSTYTSYLIVIEDWISSGFANLPQIQLRYGSTTEASGYYGSSIGTTFNSGTLVFEGTDNAAAFDFWRYSGEAFGTFITAHIERVGTGSSKDAAMTGHGIVNTNAEQYKFGMRTTVERNYTGFLLKQSGGTSSGVVTVYGLAKA